MALPSPEPVSAMITDWKAVAATVFGWLIVGLSVCGVATNVSALVILLGGRARRGHTARSMFHKLLVVLSFYDAAVVIGGALSYGLPNVWPDYAIHVVPVISQWLVPLLHVALMTSVLLTVMISLERYVRICYLCQLRDSRIVTADNLVYYVAAILVFPVLFYVPKFFEVRWDTPTLHFNRTCSAVLTDALRVAQATPGGFTHLFEVMQEDISVSSESSIFSDPYAVRTCMAASASGLSLDATTVLEARTVGVPAEPVPTALRRNPIYYKFYCVVLNTLVALVLPLAALFFLNVSTVRALHKMSEDEDVSAARRNSHAISNGSFMTASATLSVVAASSGGSARNSVILHRQSTLLAAATLEEEDEDERNADDDEDDDEAASARRLLHHDDEAPSPANDMQQAAATKEKHAAGERASSALSPACVTTAKTTTTTTTATATTAAATQRTLASDLGSKEEAMAMVGSSPKSIIKPSSSSAPVVFVSALQRAFSASFRRASWRADARAGAHRVYRRASSHVSNLTNATDHFSGRTSGPSVSTVSHSSDLHAQEHRLARISISIVWLFVFCHAWRLVPTCYEAWHSDDGFAIDSWPAWLVVVEYVSHTLIIFNSAVNFLIYVIG